MAQTSGLLLGLSHKVSAPKGATPPKMFFLAATSIKHTHPARPGDVLRLWSATDKTLGALHRFNVEARVGERLIGSGALTLALMDE